MELRSLSKMNLLKDSEMRGFLSGLPKYLSSEERVKAAIDHFFENAIFPDMSKELGDQYSKNLQQFMRLAKDERT
jgi:hypothetical protein